MTMLHKIVAALTETMISTKPDMTKKALRSVLSIYGKEYAMTDNLIQQAWTYAHGQIFGNANQNVEYARILACYLKEMQKYILELNMSNCAMTMKRLTKVVLDTEKC